MDQAEFDSPPYTHKGEHFRVCLFFSIKLSTRVRRESYLRGQRRKVRLQTVTGHVVLHIGWGQHLEHYGRHWINGRRLFFLFFSSSPDCTWRRRRRARGRRPAVSPTTCAPSAVAAASQCPGRRHEKDRVRHADGKGVGRLRRATHR